MRRIRNEACFEGWIALERFGLQSHYVSAYFLYVCSLRNRPR